MPKSKAILCSVLLIFAVSSALIYIPGIPVDQMNLYQLQVASDYLQNDLNSNFGKPTQNNTKTYAYSYMVNYFLQKLVNDPGIANYTNVIAGSANTVVGNKNIIFGNNGKVLGDKNYVFSQNFDSTKVTTGNFNDNLILDNWLMYLVNIGYIPWDPRYAIMKV